jgi:hypothetical protein
VPVPADEARLPVRRADDVAAAEGPAKARGGGLPGEGLMAIALLVRRSLPPTPRRRQRPLPSLTQCPPAPFTYANRTIALLRGTMLGRPPAERRYGTSSRSDRQSGNLADRCATVGDLMTIYVGSRYVFAILRRTSIRSPRHHVRRLRAVVSQLQTTLTRSPEPHRPRQLFFALFRSFSPPFS